MAVNFVSFTGPSGLCRDINMELIEYIGDNPDSPDNPTEAYIIEMSSGFTLYLSQEPYMKLRSALKKFGYISIGA